MRRHLTYANVMSTIAVFVVVAGGGAYAATKIGPRDIRPNAVRSKHIANGTIGIGDIGRKARRQLRGVRGPAGPAGAAGPAGPQGEPGAPGQPGPGAVCAGNGPDDVMVQAGTACIDRYEASIWDAPVGGNQITGAIPCNANGQDCDDIYARSVAGVAPIASITWFQAQAALANSGKRLPTNAEWQVAVTGTPDPGDSPGPAECNTETVPPPTETGSRADCVSTYGANDMVGNLMEWVADWDEQASDCGNWPSEGFGDDTACLGKAAPLGLPGALRRGGSTGTNAGPFAVTTTFNPAQLQAFIGFRGAR